MARRRYITILVVLAFPAGAHAQIAGSSLPADLAGGLAVPTVSGLPTAPELTTLPPMTNKPRFGYPGPDRMRVHAAGGGELHGAEGVDLLVGNTGPDRLFGETGPDRLLGGGGPDLIDGSSGG